MVYLNDSSEAANLGKDENNQLVKKKLHCTYNNASCQLGLEMNRLFLTRCSSAECPIGWKGSDASAGIILTGATNTMFRALCRGPNILILTLALGFV